MLSVVLACCIRYSLATSHQASSGKSSWSRESNSSHLDEFLADFYSKSEVSFYLENMIIKILEDLSSKNHLKRELRLPDVNCSVYGVELVASGGYAGSLNTLRRSGHAVIQRRTRPVLIIVPVAFRDIHAGYHTFTIVAGDRRQTGSLRGTAVSHLIHLKLEWYMDINRCELRYYDTVFEELSGFRINVDGLDQFGEMSKVLAEWLLNSFQSNFRQLVVQQLEMSLRTLLPRQCKDYELSRHSKKVKY